MIMGQVPLLLQTKTNYYTPEGKEEQEMKTKKILIVDDELDFLSGLQTTFEAKEYEVAAVSSKAEAQERIRLGELDIIVLGTMSPRGEASSLHKWLTQNPRTKHLPLVVIDAPLEKRLTSGWSIDEGVQMEAQEYLTKPVEPATLLPLIEALVERAAKRIKVLIVDDHTVIRDGIRAVLTLQKDITVVGEAVDGKDAVEKTLQLLPDVVVMDIVMPVMNGLEATRQICKERPETRVLMLTQYDDEENIAMSEQVGAYGFIPKRAASSQLITGVRSVYAGQRLEKPTAL
jgi:DNA-binding NarL/FixJ family response regulator